jgi:hypothetical protein
MDPLLRDFLYTCDGEPNALLFLDKQVDSLIGTSRGQNIRQLRASLSHHLWNFCPCFRPNDAIDLYAILSTLALARNMQCYWGKRRLLPLWVYVLYLQNPTNSLIF